MIDFQLGTGWTRAAKKAPYNLWFEERAVMPLTSRQLTFPNIHRRRPFSPSPRAGFAAYVIHLKDPATA